MKAIVTVLGNDRVGIIAKVSQLLSGYKVNIEDISQTLLQQYFVMIMMVDISKCDLAIDELSKKLDEAGGEIGVSIKIQHEDIFNSMHRL